ncbi:hypothetical protein B0H12DRAFT_429412 [Mycena haematopus]|nr:hypothetical protein B0H12DRAFT_429412 [Mycena haematopus]
MQRRMRKSRSSKTEHPPRVRRLCNAGSTSNVNGRVRACQVLHGPAQGRGGVPACAGIRYERRGGIVGAARTGGAACAP